MMERYEFSEGNSSKFWEVEVRGSTLTVCYGRIGTQGQTKEKQFADAAAAEKEKTRLIREKTGKGYVAAGSTASLPVCVEASVPVPASQPVKNEHAPAVHAGPEAAGECAAVSVMASETDRAGALMLQGTPLPTRTRPGRPDGQSPQQSWEALCGDLRMVIETPQSVSFAYSKNSFQKYIKTFQMMLRSSPEQLDPETVGRCYRALHEVFSMPFGVTGFDYGVAFSWMRDFVRAILGTRGSVSAIDLVPLVDANPHRYELVQQALAEAYFIAAREWLVHLPEADYAAALERALAVVTAGCSAQRACYLAFMLADDREGCSHDLQAPRLLARLAAQGFLPALELSCLPVLLDVPGPLPEAWLPDPHGNRFDLAYSFVRMEDLAASVLAMAQAGHASAVPLLERLLQIAQGGRRAAFVRALLDTHEDVIRGILLPLLDDPVVRDVMHEALAHYPRAMFRSLLWEYRGKRTGYHHRQILTKLCSEQPAGILQEWAADLDERCRSDLDALLGSMQRARTEDLPDLLREPPWRRAQKRRSVPDLVFALDMIQTPWQFNPDPDEQAPLAELTWIHGEKYARQAQHLAGVLEMIRKVEKDILLGRNAGAHELPEPGALPAEGTTEAAVADWLEARIVSLMALREGWASYDFHPYDSLLYGIPFMPAPIALRIWQYPQLMRLLYSRETNAEVMCARFGEAAMPTVLKMVESAPVEYQKLVLKLDDSRLAVPVVFGGAQRKTAKMAAQLWCSRYPRAAAFGLIPAAVGGQGKLRDVAGAALRGLLARQPQTRAFLDEAVAAYAVQCAGVAQAVEQVLARDSLEEVPSRCPKLPAWYQPGVLTPPRLNSGGLLPDEAILAVGEMLAFCNPDVPYAGLEVLRHSCTGQSLEDFAWDVFSAWLAEGAAARENWAMRALGWLGGDEAARRLTPLIRRWPGEAAHARAVTALDVLADIGSDVALMHLNGIAEKLKFKGLQEKAREKIAAIAEARELTPEELADRLVPDLDLDERGGLDLDFGSRRFRAGFDELLKPWIKDSNGVRLKDLPRPNKSDDAELAAQASARWSTLKKDARAVASLQLVRLENLLRSGRRIQPEVFETFFARHPLVRNLAQRLVWGVYAVDSTGAVLVQTFRLNEALEATNALDEVLVIDFSGTAPIQIGLVHPLQMEEEDRLAWGGLFGDYEIAQPFPQLGRDTYAFDAQELDAGTLGRFAGSQVESVRMRGMAGKGWRLGEAEDGGSIHYLMRRVKLADGRETWAVLEFGDGLLAGAMEYEEPQQTLAGVTLDDSPAAWQHGAAAHRFGELDAVNASELLRDLTQLVDAAGF